MECNPLSNVGVAWEILPLFFAVAWLYSTVGHGGASGYLALFALTGLARPSIAPVVMVLNLLVSTSGFINYYRAGHLSLKMLVPFAVASVPAAFLGGFVELTPRAFSLLLAVTMIVAAARLLLLTKAIEPRLQLSVRKIWLWGLPIGSVLGFLAGIIGIGGGIFLSPLLLFLKWANAKTTAAVSSAFIMVNSISGLTARMLHTNLQLDLLLPLAAVVLIGGQMGSRFGAFRLTSTTIQRLLGVVMLVAALKLLVDAFG